MSDDLDIRYGGVIAVDTESLRDAGERLGALAARLGEAKAAMARAVTAIHEVQAGATSTFSAGVDVYRLVDGRERLANLQDASRDASTGTLLMADAYEVVELRAQAEALRLVDDDAAARAVQARVDRLLASDDRLASMTMWMEREWEAGRFEGLHDQYDIGGLLAPLFTTVASAAVISGLGTIPAGMLLRGKADAVALTATPARSPGGPPASLAQALQRFPTAPGSQVRVERYAMADGSRHFVAYVVGTQSVAMGGSQPWDMRSNSQLYTGEKSASYQATIDAIAAAGAEPGDRVDLVGHSQGGMVTARVAMESGYDVGVQISAGSPVEPSLRDDQLLIQLRHTDDVVSALAAGGSQAGSGSPDSFTAQRVGDAAPGWSDVVLAPHTLESYLETAQMVDESGDERAGALGEAWRELDQAVEITVTDYRAERTG